MMLAIIDGKIRKSRIERKIKQQMQ